MAQRSRIPVIETVFIFPLVDERRQLESAKKKAEQHPSGFSNVCYHKYGEHCNNKCYTFDIHEEESDDGVGTDS